MARKNETILNLLAAAPWWISVVVAVTAFLVLRYILPAVYGENLAAKGFARAAHDFAPWVSLVFLLPAPISVYNSCREKRLLDSQKDLDSIRSLNWREFEELVGEAYRRQGYTVRENSGAGPDGGIDLILSKDGNTLVVQCKQWRSMKVGVKVVREMYGIMTAKHASGVIIITSGMFTQEAKSFASGKPIDLVEGRQLADLIGSVQKTEAGDSKVQVTPASTVNVCPQCGGELVLRTARKGANAGNQFYGCSRFPSCRYTRDIEAES